MWPAVQNFQCVLRTFSFVSRDISSGIHRYILCLFIRVSQIPELFSVYDFIYTHRYFLARSSIMGTRDLTFLQDVHSAVVSSPWLTFPNLPVHTRVINLFYRSYFLLPLMSGYGGDLSIHIFF